MSNDTRRAHGGFCNHVIRNIICSALAKKHNLKFIYGYAGETKDLGIFLFDDGTEYHQTIMYLHECHIDEYLKRDTIDFNLFACEQFYQGKYCADFVRNALNEPRQRDAIVEKNKFKERYDSNQDVFVHVRLGDAESVNPGFHYYDQLLEMLKPYHMGYIASDCIEHPICDKLIKKHNLIPVMLNPIETIMFGSTCKYQILSAGSFSWMIGVLGYFSTVFFPNFRDKHSICPFELFDFPDWNPVDYDATQEDNSCSS